LPQYIESVKGMRKPSVFNWQHGFEDKTRVYESQPNNFNYNVNYQNPMRFLVAKVEFLYHNRVFFVMPDNYIADYNYYFGGLQVLGNRITADYPHLFQWDIISYYNPFQFNRWEVDYYGKIWQTFGNSWWQVNLLKS
jgi:hypothetical protein